MKIVAWLLVALSAISAFLFLTIPSNSCTKKVDIQASIQNHPQEAGLLLLHELDKANEEIKRNEEAENTVIHYRFLLLGAILWGLITAANWSKNDKTLRFTYDVVAKGSYTILFFALAFFISMLLDARIRNLTKDTYDISQWILRTEQTIMQTDLKSCYPSDPSDPSKKINIISKEPCAYEIWLYQDRCPDGKSDEDSTFISTDGFYEYFTIHSLSLILFTIFAFLFFSGLVTKEQNREWKISAGIGYFLVLLGLLAFASSVPITKKYIVSGHVLLMESSIVITIVTFILSLFCPKKAPPIPPKRLFP